MNLNLHAKLEEYIESLPAGTRPKLLLHSCCGPCSTYVLSFLARYFDITLFFYNPNIMPEAEYHKRLATQLQVLEQLPLPTRVHFVEGKYDNDTYLTLVKGLENEPEHGKRCEICMNMRIRKCAEFAAANGFDLFCTTLSVSPHKDAELLYRLSEQASSEFGIRFLPADFKKKNGFLESTRLSKELGLYRQNYCGCIFSKWDEAE